MVATNTYSIIVRGRLQNDPSHDPDLTAASASTAVLDAIVVNGTEVDLSLLAADEIAAVKAAIKQAVVDKLD